MKSKKLTVFLSLACAVIVAACSCLQAEQQAIAKNLIRLHVVADSDDAEDQRRKLLVRDAVLAQTQKLNAEYPDLAPKMILSENLDSIRLAAEKTLREAGCADAVTVRLGKELFPTRAYDSFSLPAGAYESLRVNIGNAEGHNWWCVVFPSLCMAATSEEFVQAAKLAGLSDGQIRLITEEDETYVVKFKVLEWIEQLKNLFWDA